MISILFLQFRLQDLLPPLSTDHRVCIVVALEVEMDDAFLEKLRSCQTCRKAVKAGYRTRCGRVSWASWVVFPN